LATVLGNLTAASSPLPIHAPGQGQWDINRSLCLHLSLHLHLSLSPSLARPRSRLRLLMLAFGQCRAPSRWGFKRPPPWRLGSPPQPWAMKVTSSDPIPHPLLTLF
jgi:hypothetical protein